MGHIEDLAKGFSETLSVGPSNAYVVYLRRYADAFHADPSMPEFYVRIIKSLTHIPSKVVNNPKGGADGKLDRM